MPILEVIKLTKYFGGLAAIHNFDLEINKGEIVGLIGPNGSGKTTAFNLISGFIKPNSGQIIFKGEDITGLKPHKVAKKGIGRTFQHATLFRQQSSLQNMIVGCYEKCEVKFWGSFFNTRSNYKKEKASETKAMELLKFVGMEPRKDVLAGNLSHGYQKTLNFAIPLGADPELLLLDEPLTTLNPERVAAIQDLIRKIRNNGCTVLVIEHNMKALFPICDRIVVLDAGVKIAEGKPEEIRGNQKVIRIYLGGAIHARDRG